MFGSGLLSFGSYVYFTSPQLYIFINTLSVIIWFASAPEIVPGSSIIQFVSTKRDITITVYITTLIYFLISVFLLSNLSFFLKSMHKKARHFTGQILANLYFSVLRFTKAHKTFIHTRLNSNSSTFSKSSGDTSTFTSAFVSGSQYTQVTSGFQGISTYIFWPVILFLTASPNA
ncbi:hypothetical protein LEP1GSC082_1245 [Leptospira kirschneri str. H2]|nr:hypothetical protein LEP1GSC082_1245 [Leptospira kirschneri str. H2]